MLKNMIETNKYLMERGLVLPNNKIMLKEPIFVFKKVYQKDTNKSWSSIGTHCIANLVIPAGALVNLAGGSSMKLRANQAYCFSIVRKDGKQKYSSAISGQDPNFIYHSGEKLGLKTDHFKKAVFNLEETLVHRTWSNDKNSNKYQAMKKCKVVPTSFNAGPEVCASGVHFFLELELAKNY